MTRGLWLAAGVSIECGNTHQAANLADERSVGLEELAPTGISCWRGGGALLAVFGKYGKCDHVLLRDDLVATLF